MEDDLGETCGVFLVIVFIIVMFITFWFIAIPATLFFFSIYLFKRRKYEKQSKKFLDRIKEKPKPITKECSYCGLKIDRDLAEYCPYCGNKV